MGPVFRAFQVKVVPGVLLHLHALQDITIDCRAVQRAAADPELLMN